MSADYVPEHKADLLGVIQSERDRLVSPLEGLTESQLVEPGVEAAWSVKDILAHIAAWERVAIDIVQSARDGEPLKAHIPKIFESIDRFNAQVYEQNKDQPLAEILAESQAAYQEFLRLIETLSWDFLMSYLPFEGTEELTVQHMVSSNTHWHYLEHAASIQKWLAV